MPPTAADIWRLLDKPVTLEQLVESLSSMHSVAQEVITRDGEGLLAHMPSED
ncbi:MAG: PqqD family protein [Actinomycetota bacterium]